MADFPRIHIKGLFTYPNPIGEVPPGSLVIGDNIVIDADGAAQSRRGFDDLAERIGTGASRANKLFSYQGQLLVQYNADKLAYRVPSVGWTDYSGSFAPIDAAAVKTRAVEANSNFYFTSALGVRKLDLYNGTPTIAGGVKALDLSSALVGGGSGFLTNNTVLVTTGDTHSNTTIDNLASVTGITIGQYISGTGIPAGATVTAISGTTVTLSVAATATAAGITVTFCNGAQVAYRLVWGIKDENRNLILGEPSQRSVVSNSTGASSNVTNTFTIPATITTAYFYQLYRSPASISATTEPNDECQLVLEGNPSAGDISTGSITVTDSTPDSLKGATIYTASSQEGILQANSPPPLAADIAFFRTMMLYANTLSPFRLSLSLLSVGGSSGLAVNDVITVNGIGFTGKTSRNVASNQFKVFTTGTPAQNIANTAIDLCIVINQTASSVGVYAYYVSGYADLPGKMVLESRSLGGSAFAVTASAHGSAYSPALPTSGTAVSGTQDVFLNAVYVSKLGQPEAVPLTNVFFVGSAAAPIRRIIPLRDSVFIFKDDGIFKLIGQTPNNLYVDLFDSTTKLLAPDTAVSLNNSIYGLSNQGVMSASDTGIAIVSRPIEGDLLTLFGADPTAIANESWAVSYESDRKYILGVITNGGDSVPTQVYVYNLFTNAWTRWPMSKVSGLVNQADGKLYFGDALSNTVNIERKNYDLTDYVDGSFSLNVLSSSGLQVVVNSITGIAAGDLLYQTSSIKSVVTAIDVSSNTLTVANLLTWSNGSASIFRAIECIMQFQPHFGDHPEMLKQFSEIALFFKRAQFVTASLTFTSDLSPAPSVLPVQSIGTGQFGSFPFGSIIFGGARQAKPVRTYVPRAQQYSSQLNVTFTHRQAYGDFFLDGYSVKARNISERMTR